ncbi:MAG: winged helix-turn-helix transcriptional regulator [archaeon]
MVLDLLDRKIMYELDINARMSATAIGKKVRASKETVNYRLNRLLKQGYINGFYTVFDTAKLGFYYYKTFIKFHHTTPEIEKGIIEYLRVNPGCAYLGSCEGPYDALFLIMVRSAREFREFWQDFSGRFGEHILDKAIHTVLTTHRLNLKFLHRGESSMHSYYQDELGSYSVDAVDSQIMQLLSKDARMSLVEIGRRVDIDPQVVKYRIKKLEQDGIILSYTSSPNFSKLGLQFIQLNFSLKNLSTIPSIIEFFDRTNTCLYALELLGRYDLTIEIHVESDRAFRRIMDSFKKDFVDQYHDYDAYSVYREHLVVWLPSSGASGTIAAIAAIAASAAAPHTS